MIDTNEARGLTVNVYRTKAFGGVDCTNKGASAKADEFTVVGVVREPRSKEVLIQPMPRDSRVFAPTDKAPAAVLVQSQLGGATPHLVPLDVYLSGRWSMDGGNLADSSDSRWTAVVSSFLPAGLHVSAISIHDRVETAEQSRQLSI